MRHHPRLVLPLILALSACQVLPTARSSGTASVKPSARATAAPVPGPKIDPASLPINKLQKPKGETHRLAGKIQLDAGYLVAAGGGTLIGNGGSTAVAAGGATLIGNGGATLIGNGGSTLIGNGGATLIGNGGSTIVAAGGGNVVATGAVLIGSDGASLIGSDGGSLIGQDAAGIVAGGGGNIVAGGGGNLIGQGGATFKVLQASGMATGTPLPAAGVLVGVISLADGKPLPLGVGADGKPVYLVYSNAAGEFEIFVPGEVANNVLIVASVPGVQDGRLAVNLVAPPKELAAAVVDERSTIMTSYLRQTIVSRMQDGYAAHPEIIGQTAVPVFKNVDVPLVQAVIEQLFKLYLNNLQEKPFPQLLPARKRRVLQHFADRAIATIDLPEVPLDTALFAAETAILKDRNIGFKALPLLQGELDAFTAAAAIKLRDDPGHFEHAAYLKVANFGKIPSDRYEIRKAADITDFMVHEYFSSNDRAMQCQIENVMVDFDLSIRESQAAVRLAGGSLVIAMLKGLLMQNEKVDGVASINNEVKEAADAEFEAQTHDTQPTALATASPPPPAPLACQVSTIAGAGTPGLHDGPGATALFNAPARLVLDGQGHLFVSDTDNHCIRRIDLTDPTHPVTTLVGNGTVGYADGKGGADGPTRLNWPMGLDLDAQGRLYVADRGNSAIRMIEEPNSAQPRISTLAGGKAGFLDGPGATAMLNSPFDLAVSPAGSLYVADTHNFRLRRIDLQDPNHPVATLAGDGTPHVGFGRGEKASFYHATGLNWSPTGDLVVVEGWDPLISRVDRDGRLTFYAGVSNEKDHAADGWWNVASFSLPSDAAIDSAGTVYVVDTNNHRIRRIDTNLFVTTIAGGSPAADAPLANVPPTSHFDPTKDLVNGVAVDRPSGSFSDGAGSAARFNFPGGVAVDRDGTLYVADTMNHRIRKITF